MRDGLFLLIVPVGTCMAVGAICAWHFWALSVGVPLEIALMMVGFRYVG